MSFTMPRTDDDLASSMNVANVQRQLLPPAGDCGPALVWISGSIAYPGLSFLFQSVDGKLRFADHQDTSEHETRHGRCSGDDAGRGGKFKERFLVVIGGNRAPDGHKSRGRKQPESSIESPQRPDEQVRAHLQRGQLRAPSAKIGVSRFEPRQFRRYDPRAVDHARQAVAGAKGKDRRCIRKDGGRHDRREHAERIVDNRGVLQGINIL